MHMLLQVVGRHVNCGTIYAADSVTVHAQIAWSAYLSNLSSVRLRITGHGHF